MSYIHSGLKITFKNESPRKRFDLTPSRRHPGVPRPGWCTEGQKPAGHRDAVHARTRQRREDGSRPCSGPNRPTRRSAPTSTASAPPSGGTHENGFKSGIVKAVRNFMETHEVKIKGLTITAEDIREGIVGILSVFVREPHVPGADQGEAQQPGNDGDGRQLRPAGPGSLAQRQQDGRRPDRRPHRAGGQGPAGIARGGQEVKRKSATQRAAQPARQARRLQVDRPGRVGAVHRRRRLGRRLGQAGPRQPARRPCCRCAARSSTPKGWR